MLCEITGFVGGPITFWFGFHVLAPFWAADFCASHDDSR